MSECKVIEAAQRELPRREAMKGHVDENFPAYELSILNALGVSRFDFQRQQLEI